MDVLDLESARAVVPRKAATVLILREATDRLEVLMVRRSDSARFMPGAYVFPGGAVDPQDAEAGCDESPEALEARLGGVFGLGADVRSFAVAAIRESLEECGLWLGMDRPGFDPLGLRQRLFSGAPLSDVARDAGAPIATSALLPWARWVTPLGRSRRFDTLFFLSREPAGQTPVVDARETTTLEWINPSRALAANREGRLQVEFATRSVLRSLQPFETLNSCLRHAEGLAEIPAVRPRYQLGPDGKAVKVLLPGDAGYEEGFRD